jgi:hypothetical protein
MRERAHGDGMQIGYDSPEAFEEVLWKAFWPRKYLSDRISLWSQLDRDEEFEAFFRNHIRKIIALRSGGQRYVSKNNANISRLVLLPGIFPDCKIVIPVRNPLSHTQSMLRQHTRFIEVHGQDSFGRRYMEWLGHYEFGAILRPIDFQQWLDDNPTLKRDTLDFWLSYWIATYGYILAHAGPNIVFVDYDRLCTEPVPGLRKLARVLEIESSPTLTGQAARFRAPTHYGSSRHRSSGRLEEQAEDIRKALLARSLQNLDG